MSSFCFTGTLKYFKREDAAKRTNQCGHIVHTTVGPHTDYLVLGEQTNIKGAISAKEKLAKSYGVKVITEQEWGKIVGATSMVANSVPPPPPPDQVPDDNDDGGAIGKLEFKTLKKDSRGRVTIEAYVSKYAWRSMSSVIFRQKANAGLENAKKVGVVSELYECDTAPNIPTQLSGDGEEPFPFHITIFLKRKV